MKQVKNWAQYKENWADFIDAATDLVMEACVALVVVCLILPALFIVTLGFAPDEVKEIDYDGKS